MQAQNVPAPLSNLNITDINATLPEAVGMQTGVLLPNPDTPTCEVGIGYVLVNASVALQNDSQPTSSPVPALVTGEIRLQLGNLQSSDVQVNATEPLNLYTHCLESVKVC